MAFNSNDWLIDNLSGDDGFDLPANMQPGSAMANERIARGLPMTATSLSQIKRRRRLAKKNRKTR
ncbi:MAG: hypothetical protein COA84_07715 [Robiginitomaculum sp.]|nr:MAG: hypothetical protein COA84_07715 [Robiginitomaculum sp.]